MLENLDLPRLWPPLYQPAQQAVFPVRCHLPAKVLTPHLAHGVLHLAPVRYGRAQSQQRCAILGPGDHEGRHPQPGSRRRLIRHRPCSAGGKVALGGVRSSMLRHGTNAGDARNGAANHRSITASTFAFMPPVDIASLRACQPSAVPIRAAVLESTKAWMRSGRHDAADCAMTPPIDKPTNTTGRPAAAAISAMASSA